MACVLALAIFAAGIHCACAGMLEARPAHHQQAHACCKHSTAGEQQGRHDRGGGGTTGCAHCKLDGVVAKTNDATTLLVPAAASVVPPIIAPTPASLVAAPMGRATQLTTGEFSPTPARALLARHCALTL